jgi:hypothetical protein
MKDQNTPSQTVVTEQTSWDFRGDDIVRSSHGSFSEIFAAYAASLVQESVSAERLTVSAAVRYRDDERGYDCEVAIHLFLEAVSPVSTEHDVWLVEGPTTDHTGNRARLLFAGNELSLVSLIRTTVLSAVPVTRSLVG